MITFPASAARAVCQPSGGLLSLIVNRVHRPKIDYVGLCHIAKRCCTAEPDRNQGKADIAGPAIGSSRSRLTHYGNGTYERGDASQSRQNCSCKATEAGITSGPSANISTRPSLFACRPMASL
jgi:hypothetical protein